MTWKDEEIEANEARTVPVQTHLETLEIDLADCSEQEMSALHDLTEAARWYGEMVKNRKRLEMLLAKEKNHG